MSQEPNKSNIDYSKELNIDEIFNEVTEYSLVILDETLSSTGSFEASYIASEIISGFSMAKCRGIFSTHLHELTAKKKLLSITMFLTKLLSKL